jgi:effector-binding domain-containing protein
MAYECRVEERPAQYTVSTLARTPVDKLSELLGAAFGAVYGYLMELGEQPAGPPYVAYYNMDMQDLNLEIGFPVAKSLPAKGELHSGQIAGGRAATVLHIGPYDKLHLAYDALMKWVAEQGVEPAGPAYEFYLNDPDSVAPEELQTQIVFPLA